MIRPGGQKLSIAPFRISQASSLVQLAGGCQIAVETCSGGVRSDFSTMLVC
jgi:hypothetical protein